MERCNSARMESRLCTEPFLRISTASSAYKAATLSACPALNSCTQVFRSLSIAVLKSSAFVDWPVVAGACPETIGAPSSMTSRRRGEYEMRPIICLLKDDDKVAFLVQTRELDSPV